MDLDRLRAVVAAIPPGAWMSYGDVAAAAGGTDRHARTLNQRFIREGYEGAHRVLKSDGTVGGTAPGAPAGPRAPGGGARGGCLADWGRRAWSSGAAAPPRRPASARLPRSRRRRRWSRP